MSSARFSFERRLDPPYRTLRPSLHAEACTPAVQRGPIRIGGTSLARRAPPFLYTMINAQLLL